MTANPLFERQHFERLKEAQQQLSAVVPLLDKMETCGAECQQLRTAVVEMQDQLQSIEKFFMTPTPT